MIGGERTVCVTLRLGKAAGREAKNVLSATVSSLEFDGLLIRAAALPHRARPFCSPKSAH